ncbi:hypothetical protein [Verrucomicrobium sp. BvORR106]|uniref:hypothetical protein n=1 Tax=Verrucomicrobium sp. BvORR106 TaxID=1403819 RepID=UPI00056F174D|nr:hypothetical protein [Verrucomicrobium sp. BvORR106]
MNLSRLAHSAACLALVAGLSACSMFGSKSSVSQSAPVGAQEFDPFSNTWRPVSRVVVPPPSEPNPEIAAQQEQVKKQNSVVNKMGRSAGKVGNAAGAVGKTLAKPLKWIPFVGGKKSAEDEVDPAYSPASPQ